MLNNYNFETNHYRNNMARLVNGITGPFIGSIGPVVGSSWKGIPYMKAKYSKRTKSISDKEKGNRKKFAYVQEWLKPLLPFVRVGFKGYTPTVEGFIAAKSYIMKNAMEGAGADSKINPELVKVSVGSLSLSDNITVQLIDEFDLRFSWNTVYPQEGSMRDQVMMLAYDIENKKAYPITAGQLRSTGSDTLPLPAIKDRTYHIYAAFVAVDRSRQSDSVYLGAIKV